MENIVIIALIGYNRCSLRDYYETKFTVSSFMKLTWLHTKVIIVFHKYVLENVAIGKRDGYGLIYHDSSCLYMGGKKTN